MNKRKTSTLIVIVSPIIILIFGNIVARICLNLLGNWAWMGYFPIYWCTLLLFVLFFGDRDKQTKWFQKSSGSRWWILLSVGMGVISFPILLFPNIYVMNSVYLILAWLCFSFINGTLEEVYWRGFMLDGTDQYPRAFGLIYSTILFTIIHPLNLGVFSKIQAYDPERPMFLAPFLIILIMLSLVYSLLYFKTKSLRLSIFSHFLTDLGNLSIFLFMNMVHI